MFLLSQKHSYLVSLISLVLVQVSCLMSHVQSGQIVTGASATHGFREGEPSESRQGQTYSNGEQPGKVRWCFAEEKSIQP